MTLCAIVVTFNRLEQLQFTLVRLLSGTADHIIVIDNASDDGTDAWLATQDDPRLLVITLPDNRGGAGGFEAGMAAARDTFDPDWVVLMDDDARPIRGALTQFLSEIAKLDPDTGAVAASVVHPDGKLCEINRVSRNPFWNRRLFTNTLLRGTRSGFHLADDAFAPGAPNRPIDIASFVGYFVNRAAIAKVGLPEGGLFIYGDDVLYSLRLRRAGFGITLMPSVRFEHDCSPRDQGYVYRPLWKIYYHSRNGVSIARQAAGSVVFPAALAYYTLIWWRRGRHYSGEDRVLYKQMMWAGLRDGLRGKRGRNDAIHNVEDVWR